MHSTWPSHSHSFHSSLVLTISDGRYNLWSYTLCCFLQFPIIFSHKILQTNQHCSHTQSTVFPQCHRPSVTPTGIKIPHKHKHVYTSIPSFLKAGRRARQFESAVCNSPNSFPLNFFTLQSLLLNATPWYFKFPTLPKFQTIYQLGHVFIVWNPQCSSRIHNMGRNLACQCTTLL
jgi:hypothetical protein